MNVKELEDFVEEVIAFLKAIEKWLPGRVDPELVSLLEMVKGHPWLLDLLVKVLPQKVK